MDIERLRLAVWRNHTVLELSPSAAIEQLVRNQNAGRAARKVRVAGWIAGPRPGQLQHEHAVFEVEGEGTTLKVLLPRSETTGLVRGQRIVIEGRMGLEPAGEFLQPVLKGQRVENTSLDRLEPRSQPRLVLEDFFRSYESGLVILGTERALHDVDDALERGGIDPGTVRREIVRMASRTEVIAAARRYSRLAKGILFVRRGASEQEFAFWNDPVFIEDLLSCPLHFYLALGHPETRTAFDAFADEVFATPLSAGQALVAAYQRPASEPIHVALAPEMAALPSSMELPAAGDPKPYLSNTTIWIIALTLGAIILIIGLR